MKTENQSCCFCFRIASGGNLVNSDILDLLKFLISNVDTCALENSPVCDGCLNTILETCEYKTRNSTKTLVETKKEIDHEKPVVCQKCNSLCEAEHTLPLVDCVTQINWSDFVNYLFPDQDSQSLEGLQICGSCQVSLSNIQDFLILIYVHDQSRMKCDIDNCDDIKATENENLVRDKVEIKQEFENFISDDKTEIQNIIEDNKAEIEHLIEDNKVEMIPIDSKGDSDLSYANFKCKNEEIELKFESDENQSSDRCEKVDVDTEITSNGGRNKNSFNNEEEEDTVNSQGCSNMLKSDVKVQNTIRNFKCIYCAKGFSNKLILENHLLGIHNCRDGVTNNIHACDKCSYTTTKKSYMLRHKRKHDIKHYKCENCIYETYRKSNLITHIKTHKNISEIKCTFCSKAFTAKKYLDDHLLTVHKSRDKVTSKIHECDNSTTKKQHLLEHNLKQGIPVGLKKHKCQNCIYETYKKSSFIRHLKIHKNIRDFKCTLCLKNYTAKVHLDNHLLIVHKSRDKITSKIHECDKCSYSTINKNCFLSHKLKHGITVGLEKHKCHNCIYETYRKSCLIRHMKTHKNIREFKCALCSKHFTTKVHLDDHLLRFHKSRDEVTSKIFECDKCNYSTTKICKLLEHKLKHGIRVGLQTYKCLNCIYETYTKRHLIYHMKTHKNIRDFKCSFCSKIFVTKMHLIEHLLAVHKSRNKVTSKRDEVTSKIHECNKCSYSTTRKSDLLTHKLKHGITVGFEKHKCHNCIYETYRKNDLIKHMNTHKNIREFKCALCTKDFPKKVHLDVHLLRVHKRRDEVTNKIHECDKCSYSTTRKSDLLQHKLKHGITVGLEKHKCHNCIYETYRKSNLIAHMKTHKNIGEFNCVLCSKNFTVKRSLDNHLLIVHKSRDQVTRKIFECDKCDFLTTKQCNLLKHNLKHGITVGLQKYKCLNCIYETYTKSYLICHMKTHENIRDFKCTFCSKNFVTKVDLIEHLLEVHKSRDQVTSKTHECNKCSYSTTRKSALLDHKLKHGITVGLEKYKCHNCIYETYRKSNLTKHMKSHKNLRNYKCALCLKHFTTKQYLDDHLLIVHKSRDNVTSKIHECDRCSYLTTRKNSLLRHKLKHGKTAELPRYKCQYCIYETYDKGNLNRHIKTHKK